MGKILTYIMCIDYRQIQYQIEKLNSFTDYFHFDIMDGYYVLLCHTCNDILIGVYYPSIKLLKDSMKKYKVTLSREEREELMSIAGKRSHRSQKILVALILLNCDEGKFQRRRLKNEEIAAVLNISMRKMIV